MKKGELLSKGSQSSFRNPNQKPIGPETNPTPTQTDSQKKDQVELLDPKSYPVSIQRIIDVINNDNVLRPAAIDEKKAWAVVVVWGLKFNHFEEIPKFFNITPDYIQSCIVHVLNEESVVETWGRIDSALKKSETEIAKRFVDNQVLINLRNQGFSHRQIAEKLGLTKVAVDQRFIRMRKANLRTTNGPKT